MTTESKPVLSEGEKWQHMMHSCREACKILNVDFKEPPYQNWREGDTYFRSLWLAVKEKRGKNGRH